VDSGRIVIFSAADRQSIKSILEAHIKSASLWSKIFTLLFALVVCSICGTVDSIDAFAIFVMIRFYPFVWFAVGVFVPVVEHLLSISDKMWQMIINKMYSFKCARINDTSIGSAHQEVDQTWQRLNLWLQHLTVHTKDLWASIFSSILAMTIVVFVVVIVFMALSYVAHSTNCFGPSLVEVCAGIWTTAHFLFGLLPIVQFSDMLVSIGSTLHGAVLRNNCVPMTEQERQGFCCFTQTLLDLKQRKALGVQLPLVGTIGKLIGLLSGITPMAITSMIFFPN
jgi:hypothetical protein